MSEEKYKFPTETIDLPSGGKLYSKDSPLSSGKLDVKYMTAKEEDILTSQTLIKKGIVIDKLLDSLIVTEGVKTEDLILGDKNAVMVAARILAYGPDYECEIVNPDDNKTVNYTFDLSSCPFKNTPEDVSENNFSAELPASKANITFKLLTGKEEKMIEEEISSLKKTGSQILPELTTRLRYTVTSVDGDSTQGVINNFVANMLSRDSLFLRKKITEVSPDIQLEQEVEIGGETVTVNIPMTVNFFWPKT